MTMRYICRRQVSPSHGGVGWYCAEAVSRSLYQDPGWGSVNLSHVFALPVETMIETISHVYTSVLLNLTILVAIVNVEGEIPANLSTVERI